MEEFRPKSNSVPRCLPTSHYDWIISLLQLILFWGYIADTLEKVLPVS